MFAAATESGVMYPYIDASTNNTLLIAANSATSQVFEFSKIDFESYGIKTVMTLKGSLRIESGKGTIDKPYKLK